MCLIPASGACAKCLIALENLLEPADVCLVKSSGELVSEFFLNIKINQNGSYLLAKAQ